MSHEFFTLLQKNEKDTLTYLIASKIIKPEEVTYYLVHPLSPEAFIHVTGKTEEEVLSQQVQTTGKSITQIQLEYAKRNGEYLDYAHRVDVDSITLYFVVNRTISAPQKNRLSAICGNVASIVCNNDLNLAIRFVNENEALLDEYNIYWYGMLERFFKGKEKAHTKKQRAAIFNMAGFVLSQLDQR